MIYLIKLADNDCCKIGYTANIKAKLRSISTYSPFKIELHMLRDGSHAEEHHLHSLIKNHCIRGEWFTFCREVVEIFANAKLGYEYRVKAWRNDFPYDHYDSETPAWTLDAVFEHQWRGRVPELRSYQIKALAKEA